MNKTYGSVSTRIFICVSVS